MTREEQATVDEAYRRLIDYGSAPAAIGAAMDGLVFLLDTVLNEVRDLRAEVEALRA